MPPAITVCDPTDTIDICMPIAFLVTLYIISVDFWYVIYDRIVYRLIGAVCSTCHFKC